MSAENVATAVSPTPADNLLASKLVINLSPDGGEQIDPVPMKSAIKPEVVESGSGGKTGSNKIEELVMQVASAAAAASESSPSSSSSSPLVSASSVSTAAAAAASLWFATLGVDSPLHPLQMPPTDSPSLENSLIRATLTGSGVLPLGGHGSRIEDGKTRSTPERKRRHSNESLDSSTKASESAVDDIKDEDDDNDEDEDDTKLPSHDRDPDRLKAFNLFVRLFIDENLDRSIPISKQPKDKVQAILDACDRQFPEFHDRARKRIRTYLKSCRRLRRTKDGPMGLIQEPIRPTPPHLTSAAAETILAMACDNESNNAKRMRVGLEPLPSTLSPLRSSNNTNSSGSNTRSSPSAVPHPGMLASGGASRQQPQQLGRHQQPNVHSGKSETSSPIATTHGIAKPASVNLSPLQPGIGSILESRNLPAASLRNSFRDCFDLSAVPFYVNGGQSIDGSVRRALFPIHPGSTGHGSQRPAHSQQKQHHLPIVGSLPLVNNNNNTNSSNNNNNNHHLSHQNALPTDLSIKKPSSVRPQSGTHLSQSEVTTLKHLIAGYRESAAFLCRSADELEQVLQLHQK